MSENANRCPACGAGQVMGLTTHTGDACPYNKAFDFARKNKNEIDAKYPGKYKLCLDYAAAHWREYWVPKIGDWVVVQPDGVALKDVQKPFQITAAHDDYLYNKIAGYMLKQLRPAWPDEIARMPTDPLLRELQERNDTRKNAPVKVNPTERFCKDGILPPIEAPEGYVITEYRAPEVGEYYISQGSENKGGVNQACNRGRKEPRYILKPKAGAGGKAEPVLGGNSSQPIEEKPVLALPAPAAPDLSQEHDKRVQIPGLAVTIEREEKFIAARTRDLLRMKEWLRVDRRLARQKALDSLGGK